MLIFSLTLSATAFGQDDFAVLKDPDGFVNVRRADMQSEMVGRITKYQPFDCITTEEMAPQHKKMMGVEYANYETTTSGFKRTEIANSP